MKKARFTIWLSVCAGGLALAIAVLMQNHSNATRVPDTDRPADSPKDARTVAEHPKNQIPISQWQQERVASIRVETPSNVLAHLANFDDVQFASTFDGGHPFSPQEPRSVNGFLPRLFRVRRLLEEAKLHKQPVAEMMEGALHQVFEQWPEAFHTEQELWRKNNGHGFTKSEPSRHDILRVQAEAATYVLAEMQNWESLPLLLQSYAKQKEWIDAIPVEKYYCIAQCPVPPPLTLFAIHRLILSYPADKLSLSAADRRANYLKWSEAHIPQPKVFDGVSSTSLLDESDPLNRIIDPNGTRQDGEQKLSLVVYPYVFRDRTEMLDYPSAPYISKESQEWFNTIKAFYDALSN